MWDDTNYDSHEVYVGRSQVGLHSPEGQHRKDAEGAGQQGCEPVVDGAQHSQRASRGAEPGIQDRVWQLWQGGYNLNGEEGQNGPPDEQMVDECPVFCV